MSRKRKYWYYTYLYECPICGNGSTYRERRYGYRPKLWENRNEFVVDYDYCDVL